MVRRISRARSRRKLPKASEPFPKPVMIVCAVTSNDLLTAWSSESHTGKLCASKAQLAQTTRAPCRSQHANCRCASQRRGTLRDYLQAFIAHSSNIETHIGAKQRSCPLLAVDVPHNRHLSCCSAHQAMGVLYHAAFRAQPGRTQKLDACLAGLCLPCLRNSSTTSSRNKPALVERHHPTCRNTEQRWHPLNGKHCKESSQCTSARDLGSCRKLVAWIWRD